MEKVNRVIRRRELEELTGVTERAVRGWEAEGTFPKRFTLSPGGRAVGWLLSEVDSWLAERAASRTAA